MSPTLEAIATRAASSRETVQASYDLARLAIQNGIPGHFVECGVYHGAQCAAMALAIMDAGRAFAAEDRLNASLKRVHLFDSFAGVPAPGPHDKQWIEAGHPVGTALATREEVERNMAFWRIDPALLVYHEGPFENTVGQFARRYYGGERRPPGPEQIAILRLDGDLYESTRVCLEHLYALVSKGGWVIVDDFGLDGARKAVDEYMKGGYPPVMWQKA